MVRSLVALLAAGVLAISACGSDDGTGPSATDGFPMTVESCGRAVTIEEPPERVLTLAGDAAVLVWAAGGADRIIARVEGLLGPAQPALEAVPVIAPGGELSREAIIGEQPDLVITDPDLLTPEDLEAIGIDTLIPSGRCGRGSGPIPDRDVNFDDVYSDVENYGRLFGTEVKAAKAVAGLRERVAAVERRSEGAQMRTAVALYLPGNPLAAYGNLNMSHRLMEIVRLQNVFGDVDERYFEGGVEPLIDRDPDVIIASYGGVGAQIQSAEDAEKAIRALPGSDRLTAIREDRVIYVHSGYLLGSPLAVDGLETIAREIA